MSSETTETPQNLPAMCLLALAVGAIGGLGAWAFRCLIGLLHNLFFLGSLQVAYDANQHTTKNPWGAGIIVVPLIGAVLVVWLVKTFAPEARGHGVPEVIDAIHYQGGRIRPIVAVIKSLASAICIGSGGSVGREGPIIQIGSAFGSTLAQVLHIPVRQRITLVAAGAAAGIAATFNAPLGGIVFGIELLLISINVQNVLPVALASCTATYLGRYLLGPYPAFNLASLQVNDFHIGSPWMLLLLIPFGIVMGLVSVAFVQGVYWTEDRFDRLPGNEYTRHAAGMLLVGIMLFGLWQQTGRYYVAGIGYATIIDALLGRIDAAGFLLLLCLLKLGATCLTLGSGGSGGIFSPALFLGATVGAAFVHSARWLLPDLPLDAVTFILAGMAATVGASTGAMITAPVMLHEMTADSNVVLPVIVTTVIASGVRKVISPGSIYTLKLLRRGHVVPEGLQAALDDARSVRHVMETDFRVAEDGAKTVAANHVLTVWSHEGHVAGVTDPTTPSSLDTHPLQTRFAKLHASMPLVDAIRQMHAAGAGCGLVFARPGTDRTDDVVGVLTLRKLGAYRTQMAQLF